MTEYINTPQQLLTENGITDPAAVEALIDGLTYIVGKKRYYLFYSLNGWTLLSEELNTDRETTLLVPIRRS